MTDTFFHAGARKLFRSATKARWLSNLKPGYSASDFKNSMDSSLIRSNVIFSIMFYFLMGISNPSPPSNLNHMGSCSPPDFGAISTPGNWRSSKRYWVASTRFPMIELFAGLQSHGRACPHSGFGQTINPASRHFGQAGGGTSLKIAASLGLALEKTATMFFRNRLPSATSVALPFNRTIMRASVA